MTPHSTNDVRADWRWFYEVIVWPSAPKTFQTFWEKVESSGLLTLLCETSEYEKKWKDPLNYHLGEMWMAGPVLSAEVRMLVEEQLERVRTLSRKLGRIIPYLFPHLTAGHFQGERIRDFRKSWVSAYKATGLSGMLRHDLRRTAARNLIRSGVPEVMSMRITGHRTRSVFDRYNIVSPADLQDAARKMVGGHIFGHSASSPLDSVTVSR